MRSWALRPPPPSPPPGRGAKTRQRWGHKEQLHRGATGGMVDGKCYWDSARSFASPADYALPPWFCGPEAPVMWLLVADLKALHPASAVPASLPTEHAGPHPPAAVPPVSR